MVECQLPKLNTRVRFPSSAPNLETPPVKSVVFFHMKMTDKKAPHRSVGCLLFRQHVLTCFFGVYGFFASSKNRTDH